MQEIKSAGGVVMPAYLLVKAKISDWEQYQEYMKVSPAVVAQYGGRFISRGGEVVALEGPEVTERIVLLEFPSLAKVKEFYHSQEYQQIMKLRAGAATAQFIAIDGVE
jgi:uncharacterized protein (DUF1330 family)